MSASFAIFVTKSPLFNAFPPLVGASLAPWPSQVKRNPRQLRISGDVTAPLVVSSRRLLCCRPRRCPTASSSRRLTSARPALAPKCEFISARGLRHLFHHGD